MKSRPVNSSDGDTRTDWWREAAVVSLSRVPLHILARARTQPLSGPSITCALSRAGSAPTAAQTLINDSKRGIEGIRGEVTGRKRTPEIQRTIGLLIPVRWRGNKEWEI